MVFLWWLVWEELVAVGSQVANGPVGKAVLEWSE